MNALRLPGRTPLQRLAVALLVFACFYAVLALAATALNSAVASGQTTVQPAGTALDHATAP